MSKWQSMGTTYKRKKKYLGKVYIYNKQLYYESHGAMPTKIKPIELK
jgi:hypothetical protein